MPAITVQVFEHTSVRVGEALRTARAEEHIFTRKQHAALAAFADRTRDRYLSCGRHHVRFSAYVGLLQLGELGIEILPKADKEARDDFEHWHGALVRMLRVVGDLGLEAQDEANLRVDPGRLFELFIAHFLGQVDALVRVGLAKGYRTQEANSTAFRGKLLVSQHIRHNALNAARFFVASPIYDHENLPNLALREALVVVESLPVPVKLRRRAHVLGRCFAELPRWTPDESAVQRLRFSRSTARYQAALRLARLILFGLAADVRQGDTPVLALLFDMNQLWERFVAAQARRMALPSIEVRTQDSRHFWRVGASRPRSLRPDLTFTDAATGEVRLVVDTKWKLPSADRPDSSDLKQMFCYHELFGAPDTMLLYPSTTGSSEVRKMGTFIDRDHRCALAFLAVDADPGEALRALVARSLSGTSDDTHRAASANPTRPT